MPKNHKKHFAIIDIESTGGNLRKDRMTEIAIAIHDGEKVIDEYETLLNPNMVIPPFVSRLTGITDDMVADAPQFYEVAKKVATMTEDCIFVAHNVQFDYGFIQYAFKDLGYTYQRQKICTRILTKKLFPEIGRYSLERLIEHFKIKVDARHRAMADVKATVVVFDALLARDNGEISHMINYGIKASRLPMHISVEDINQLPEECGIYYFYGADGHLIYVGKSKNIKNRIAEHFRGNDNKSQKLKNQIRSIGYVLLGSELLALLVEATEIARQKPEYNRALRVSDRSLALIAIKKEDGFMHYDIIPSDALATTKGHFIRYFKNKEAAQKHLNNLYLAEKDFCACINDEKTDDRCMHRMINLCKGKAFYEKNKDIYNQQLEDKIEKRRKLRLKNGFLIDQGRTPKEYTVFKIENNSITAFQYLEDLERLDIELDEIIWIPLEINPVQTSITQTWLRKNRKKVDWKEYSF